MRRELKEEYSAEMKSMEEINREKRLLKHIPNQINHLNEHSIETEKGSTNSKLLKQSWAAQQVATSNNFATKSVFWYCLSNGLNTQIEHHLFPNICHVHYKALSPIVERTAKEFNLPYHSHKTFLGALGSHFKLLNDLGTGRYDRAQAL